METLPSAGALLRRLDVKELQAEAEDSTDAYGARAARVKLELAYVKASFYVPREALRRGKARRALLSLEVAEGILGHARCPAIPGDGPPCAGRAGTRHGEPGRASAVRSSARLPGEHGAAGGAPGRSGLQGADEALPRENRDRP
ncbi:MAG: hypothetical protein U5K31_06985 [Balneolaceae bacterium]|nr:hypothetical protein [Balneolaceae bacterium]